MIENNKRYIATSPEGTQEVVVISDSETADKHNQLAAEGWTYKEITMHASQPGSACTACEG